MMPRFDIRGFMSYLPLLIIGVIGFVIYNKFPGLFSVKGGQDARQAEKNEKQTVAEISKAVDLVADKNQKSGLKISPLHIQIADGIYTNIKTAWEDNLDSIIKQINDMKPMTLSLVYQAYGTREKTVFPNSSFKDNFYSSTCTGDLIKHLKASMTALQFSKISLKLSKL